MNQCLFCSRPTKQTISISFIFSFQVSQKAFICGLCLSQFKSLKAQTVCPGCARLQPTKRLCQECSQWAAKYPKLTPDHQALFHYNDKAKDFMSLYKFKGDLVCADIFSTHVRNFLKPYLKTHLIVPIPISLTSQKIRGFNQVDSILDRAKIPYHRLLLNQSEDLKQTRKNKAMRLETKQPFIIDQTGLKTGELKNKILIVDDVYTTGRTIYHARDILSDQFATQSFTLFR